MIVTKEKTVYKINGEIATDSIAELLERNGISNNKQKLDNKDLYLQLNEVNYHPKTIRGEKFQEYIDRHIQFGVGKCLVGYEENSFSIAGQIDMVYFDENNNRCLCYFGTTETNTEYMSWVLSLGDYFLRRIWSEKLNGNVFHWKGAKRMIALIYDESNQTLKEKEISRVSDEQVEIMIQCAKEDEPYQRPKLILDKELLWEWKRVEMQLRMLRPKLKRYRDLVLNEMSRQRVYQYCDEDIECNYIEKEILMETNDIQLKRNYQVAYMNCQSKREMPAHLNVDVKLKSKDT